MAYVAPSTVSSGDAVTAANHNIIVNDVIALREASTYVGTQTRATGYTCTSTTVAGAADVFASDITFTAVSGKLYAFELSGQHWFAPSTSSNCDVYLVNGSGTALYRMAFLRSAGGTIWCPLNLKHLYAAGSGSVSFNIRGVSSSSDAVLDPGTDQVLRFTIYGPID